MTRRFASVAVLVGALCALLGVSASAETLQLVAGARVAAIADPIAHRLVSGADRSVAAAYQVTDQTVPQGTVTVAAGGTPFVSATYVSVPIAIRVDGKLARTVVAGYRVTTYVQTAVAARDLTPGTLLEPGDVTLARVAFNGRPAVELGSLVGRKVRAATPRGTPLYVEQTAPNDLIKAGQPAILVVHDGPVALAADVVARTGGAIGDTVTVFNPQTRKALAAVVTGPNRCEIVLPGAGE